MTARRQRVRVRRTQALVGLLVIIALAVVNGPPLVGFAKHEYHQWLINTAAYKQRYGHWANLPIPPGERVNAIHSILLNNGKVLIMAGSGNNIGNFSAGKFESLIWNPANGSFKKIRTPYDMFCSGHYILPDGKVLIAGGTTRYEVLASKIQYAAGVMTIINRSRTRSLRLPAGTRLESASGYFYRSTAAVRVPPARLTPAVFRGRRIRVLVPSYTPLWVKATQRGDGPAVRTQQDFSIAGVPASATASMEATSLSISRSKQDYWGSKKAYVFDPRSERYQAVSDMHLARWYPTLVGLKDGQVLAVSGLDQFGRIIGGNSETYDRRTGSWTLRTKLRKPFPTYPALFLMPNGDLFFTGANSGYGPLGQRWRSPGIWNPNTDAFTPVHGMRDPNETETAGSLLLPPAQSQRYAIVGGGGVGESPRSTGRIDVIDLRQKNPTWHPDGSLPVGTRYPELVITPNDGVVISGGSRDYRGKHDSDLLECHLFEPASGKLSKLASPLVGRDYHAEGLLLPDGRILTLGGNPLFGNRQDTTPEVFRQKITVFSPPYLYHGHRPAVTGGPSMLARGQTATFTTPDPGQIAKVRLMHPSAVTHVTDVQQRSIAMTFQRHADSISATVPEGAGLVPSGWYMLFVDNRTGVPSVARWVHIS